MPTRSSLFRLTVAAILVSGLLLTPAGSLRSAAARQQASATRLSTAVINDQDENREKKIKPCRDKEWKAKNENFPEDNPAEEKFTGEDDPCASFGSSSGIARADFNGDGIGDLAVGVPNEDVNGIQNTGGVNIIYGSPSGLAATAGPGNQFFTLDSIYGTGVSQPGANLGTALAAGDFNGDGRTDLAIGSPGLTQFGQADAGEVEVLYGSPSGLTIGSNQFFIQGFAGLPDAVENGDRFGSSLSWGEFNGDGFGDLVIGIPSEDVGTRANAGAVQIIYGSPTGLTVTGNQFLTQDSVLNGVEVRDVAEAGDNFGRTLTAGDFNGDGRKDLVVGVPFEDIEFRTSSVVDAGGINVLFGTGSGLTAIFNQFWTQDTVDNNVAVLDVAENFDRFGSSLAAGDFNGDGRSDLAIGAPFEDLGDIANAGAVNVLYGSASAGTLSAAGNQFWRQGDDALTGTAEEGDELGSSLASGDFNADGRSDLAIGAPGNNNEFGSFIDDLGAVNVLYGSNVVTAGLTRLGQEFFRQGRFGEPSGENGLAPEDRFGSTLSSWNLDGAAGADLAIGVPGEEVGGSQDAGAVVVLYSTGSAGLFDQQLFRPQYWTQDTGGILDSAEATDGFGKALY